MDKSVYKFILRQNQLLHNVDNSAHNKVQNNGCVEFFVQDIQIKIISSSFLMHKQIWNTVYSSFALLVINTANYPSCKHDVLFAHF